jgi:hypothetical protein
MIGEDPTAYVYHEDGSRVPVTQFDYDLLDPDVELVQMSQEDVDRGLKVLNVLLNWIFQNGMKNSEGLKIRAIIICWIFLKHLRPMTLTQLATGFGMKKQSIGRWLDQFKTDFRSIRTPHMRPLKNEQP